MGAKHWGTFAVALVVAHGATALAQGADDAALKARRSLDSYSYPLAPPTSFRRLGTAEGLRSGTVTSFAQDATGAMWLGTEGGLSRLDGTVVTNFVHKDGDATSLGGSSITELAVDAGGRLWVGTEVGLHLYRGDGTFQRVGEPTAVLAMVARGGGVLVGMPEGILLEVTDPAGKPKAIEVAGEIAALAVAKDGGAWVGTEADGVFELSPALALEGKLDASGKTTPRLPSAKVHTLMALGDELFVGTMDAGLVRVDVAKKSARTYGSSPDQPTSLTDPYVKTIVAGEGSTLWVGTNNGLNLLDLATGAAVRYAAEKENPHGLSQPNIAAGFVDRAGVRWFGTVGKGAVTYDPVRGRFARYRTEREDNSFLLEADGSIWVGTNPGSLTHIDRKHQRVTVYRRLGTGEAKFDLDPYWITWIYRDPQGALWLSTMGGGLVRFRPETDEVTVFNAEHQLGSDRVLAIEPAKRGGFYVGTFDAGLKYYDPKAGTFETFGTDEGLSSEAVYLAVEDRADPDILWVGTSGGGLDRIDLKAKTAKAYRNDPAAKTSISSDNITTIYQEPSGVLWLGTYGAGIDRLDPKTDAITRFTTADGLSHDTVWGILPDESGALWMSTEGGGLSRLDLTSLKFTTYSESDGGLGDFALNGYAKGPSKEMVFGGPSGFVVFDPAKVVQDTYPPPVVLTRLKVVGKDRPVSSSTLELRYNEAAVSFEFAALSYAAPERNRFRYKLVGYDSEWVETPYTFATYTNLDPGDYRFVVQAANRHGVWNETPAQLPFEIATPPWRTWWAYLIYAAVVAAIAFAIWNRQQQKIKTLRTEQRLQTVEKDLALTAAVQGGFLPDLNTHEFGDLRLEGYWRAAESCSGDWWFYEQTSPDELSVIVGDVTGHGPGPAMVTAAVATAFRVTSGLAMMDRLQILNREVLSVGKGKYHMTLISIVINQTNGTFTYYNAGAPPGLHLVNGTKVEVLQARSTPLGYPQFSASTITGTIPPSGRVLLYTDGIPESPMPDGKMFGIRRLSKMFSSTSGVGLTEAITKIVTSADEARGPKPQDDDWTVVMLERGGAVGGARPKPAAPASPAAAAS